MNYLLEGEESKRLLYRKISSSDFNIWLEFYKDYKTSIHWTTENLSAETICKRWYDKQFKRYENGRDGMNALIEKKSGNLIGHCGLLLQKVDNKTELEIGYSLLPEFWNKGYAIEAAEKCKYFAFENNLSYSLISIISPSNKPSINVALKNGMQLSKRTIYKNTKVNIYRINKQD